MGRVQAEVLVPAPASVVEDVWYDPQRWPAVLDGFGWLRTVEGPWPKAGARTVWDSTPGGRGRVVSRVRSYEARVGQELDVEDERLRGTERIAFEPREDGTLVRLELEYAIKESRGWGPAVDLVFVRRPVRDMLTRTLRRLAVEAAAELRPPV